MNTLTTAGCVPAATVIARFGGVRPLARILGIDPSLVSRWQQPRERRGQGGLIPARYQGPILLAARERGIELSPADMVQL
jgi:hypothetical protein